MAVIGRVIDATGGGALSELPVADDNVPAGGQAELKPGGLHIMLIGLKRELNQGDAVRLILVFEKSGEIIVDAQVRAP